MSNKVTWEYPKTGSGQDWTAGAVRRELPDVLVKSALHKEPVLCSTVRAPGEKFVEVLFDCGHGLHRVEFSAETVADALNHGRTLRI